LRDSRQACAGSCDFGGAIKRKNRLRLLGSMAAVPLLLFVALCTEEPALSPAIRRFGGSLFLASGLGLRLLALGSIDGCKKQVLVTWGPYRYLRHPLYCGSLLALLAFSVHVGSFAAALLGCALFLALYLPAVRAEELFLAARFPGEWDDHRARTWALVPRPNPGRAPGPPFRLRRPWREVLVLLFLASLIAGGAEWVGHLHTKHGLPGWFY
jgi:protein-S-isoprenylcysteine O-methyltransferase Ste14